eukprot:CAMPEP_0197912668 /NCGR_PEP_ID=MMETSP1439-20131203/75226_1 /TAXON_ID=66791 /ORGANISM="Gonyaulax spinifera, Strain CCMP409" /LENGTH=87 /DNA_ID=CAMNT_0043534477 /DNA_START=1 /DNA_END=264 /DNA_ORIENTATION=+
MESSDPLMLCVSAPDWDAYQKAVALVSELVEGVYQEYNEFCAKSGKICPDLKIQLHEGPRSGAAQPWHGDGACERRTSAPRARGRAR